MATFNTPLDPEPLPIYSRDPEAASIISAAPSYVSDVPTYHSRRPSVPESDAAPPAYTPRTRQATEPANERHEVGEPNRSTTPINHGNSRSETHSSDTSSPRTGLPAPRYAQGFQARATPLSNLSMHAYNVDSWSNIYSSNASRQVQAVARRRAMRNVAATVASTASLLQSFSPIPPPLSTPPNSSSSPPATTTSALPPLVPEPFIPEEDPHLVGELAAARARSARLYRERCQRGQERFRNEGKSWDFMLAQMADWEERERGLRNLRDQFGRRKLFSRRAVGLRGH